jgi:hypothetical protein
LAEPRPRDAAPPSWRSLRQHGLSKADAIVDEDDRAALDAFLSGRTADIDIYPLEDLAHVLGLTVGQLIGDARPASIH